MEKIILVYKLLYFNLIFKKFSERKHLLLSTRLHCATFQKAAISQEFYTVTGPYYLLITWQQHILERPIISAWYVNTHEHFILV
jgi:hypothetical protein